MEIGVTFTEMDDYSCSKDPFENRTMLCQHPPTSPCGNNRQYDNEKFQPNQV